MIAIICERGSEILGQALREVSRDPTFAGLDATLLVLGREQDRQVLWQLVSDRSRRPLLVLSIMGLKHDADPGGGLRALLAQARVVYVQLPVMLADLAAAIQSAAGKTADDADAGDLFAAYVRDHAIEESRHIAHDLGGAMMAGNAAKLAALTERAAKIGVTAATPEELLEKLRLAEKESEEPTNAALDRLNKM